MSRTIPANRVKIFREARGWAQAELSERSGISRSGISAIESSRLSPSVEAALQLAHVFECSVEALFGESTNSNSPQWAWEPAVFPCRYWLGEVGGKVFAYPLELPTACVRLADGAALKGLPALENRDIARQTLVVATCDPAAPYFVELFERQSPFRLLILSRPSGEAWELLQRGLVHAAGIHWSRVNEGPGNAKLLRARHPQESLQLVRMAQWEEGLAVSRESTVNSIRQGKKQSLRWVGRLPGAAARRCQDEILGTARAPARTARDHRAVAEAIRNHWAEAGICVRLVSDEAQLRFFSICEDQYDLCFPQRMAADPRLLALVRTVRSAEYKNLLANLPGYRGADAGEVELVAANP